MSWGYNSNYTTQSNYFDISAIDCMEGHDFEYFCADMLKKNGFGAVKVTRGSGDNGVDIQCFRDGHYYAIQCKRADSKIGNHAVQEVYSGKDFYGCSKAAVLTNNYFTPAAQNAAKRLGVELWDRATLLTFAKNAYPAQSWQLSRAIRKAHSQYLRGKSSNKASNSGCGCFTWLIGIFILLCIVVLPHMDDDTESPSKENIASVSSSTSSSSSASGTSSDYSYESYDSGTDYSADQSYSQPSGQGEAPAEPANEAAGEAETASVPEGTAEQSPEATEAAEGTETSEGTEKPEEAEGAESPAEGSEEPPASQGQESVEPETPSPTDTPADTPTDTPAEEPVITTPEPVVEEAVSPEPVPETVADNSTNETP